MKKRKKCKSKMKHKTEIGAKIAIRKTLRKNFRFHKMEAYKCKHCGFWHVGRTKSILYHRFKELVN